MPDRTLTRRQFLRGASVLAVSGFAGPFARLAADAQESMDHESRMIFDEGLNWVTRASADRLCSRIARAGFNAFSPCVWHGRGTIWPSQLAPWDSHNIRAQGFDPFGNLLQTAERYQIEVHPWFTVSLRQRDFFPEFYDSGTPSEFFDVHRASFRQFISSVIFEVAATYPVHGINLDFIRAGGICLSPSCVEDYKRRTGRNLVIDAQSHEVAGPARDALISWQHAAVTDIVRRVSVSCRRAKPDIVISTSGQTGHPFTQVEGADSGKWSDDKLIDVVYNMHYEPSPDFTAIRTIQATMKRPEAMVVGIGNYEEATSHSPVHPRDPARVSALIRTARSIQRGNGVAVYLYSMLSDAQIEALSTGVFARPAKTRWIRATGPSQPQDLQVF